MANVLVTGSSTGIGQATAVSLARAGPRVFATMRNPDASGALLDLAAEHAAGIEVHKLDVTTTSPWRPASARSSPTTPSTRS